MTYVFSNFARTLSGHFQRVRLVKGGRQAHDRPLHELDHHIHEHDRAGALLSDAHRQLSQRSVAVRVRPVLCAPLDQEQSHTVVVADLAARPGRQAVRRLSPHAEHHGELEHERAGEQQRLLSERLHRPRHHQLVHQRAHAAHQNQRVRR